MMRQEYGQVVGYKDWAVDLRIFVLATKNWEEIVLEIVKKISVNA